MNNINLDINTYNTSELEKLLKLPKNYNNENIYKNKETIETSIRKSNIGDARKTELFIFLDNIKNKLINNLENVDEINVNSIKQYDGNHFLIKTKPLRVEGVYFFETLLSILVFCSAIRTKFMRIFLSLTSTFSTVNF